MVTRHISQEDYDILQEAKEIKMKTQGPMSHEEWIHYLFKTVDKQSVEITKLNNQIRILLAKLSEKS